MKNHFYAEIRKSLRRINHFIKVYLGGRFKQINVHHVSKMITVLSEKNGHIANSAHSVFSTYIIILELKKYLFSMGKKQEQEELSTLEVI